MSKQEGEFKKHIIKEWLALDDKSREEYYYKESLWIPDRFIFKFFDEAKKEIYYAWFKGTNLQEFQEILMKWFGDKEE